MNCTRETLVRNAIRLSNLICDGYADLRAMPAGTPICANADRWHLLASQEEALADVLARIDAIDAARPMAA